MYSSLYVLGLLFLLVCSHCAVVIQFFVPDENTRNVIALECIADGLSRAGATFQFFSGLDESTLQSDIFSESDRLEVAVEHTSEQFIRCVFDGEMSNFLAVAGSHNTVGIILKFPFSFVLVPYHGYIVGWVFSVHTTNK